MNAYLETVFGLTAHMYRTGYPHRGGGPEMCHDTGAIAFIGASMAGLTATHVLATAG